MFQLKFMSQLLRRLRKAPLEVDLSKNSKLQISKSVLRQMTKQSKRPAGVVRRNRNRSDAPSVQNISTLSEIIPMKSPTVSVQESEKAHSKRKVALYARVSTDQQTGGLESQIRAMKEQCGRMK